MTKDWDAVAAAINTRMDELGLTQQEVANRAGVALQTVRELQHNLIVRKRTPRTLEVMSAALGLPRSYLAAVLNGDTPLSSGADEPSVLADVQEKLADIMQRLEVLERQVQRP